MRVFVLVIKCFGWKIIYVIFIYSVLVRISRIDLVNCKEGDIYLCVWKKKIGFGWVLDIFVIDKLYLDFILCSSLEKLFFVLIKMFFFDVYNGFYSFFLKYLFSILE